MLTPEILQRFLNACEETKKGLPRGPWMDEEHRMEFKHAGLDCLLSRNPEMFNWCGYVGVPKDHPLFGKTYDDVYEWTKKTDLEIDVHGGLTYSDQCQGKICHMTEDPGDKVWWFGFDCAHAYDLVPSMLKFREDLKDNTEHPILSTYRSLMRDTYRDVNFVTHQVIKLAEQLAQVA
jgi:hypothetical protein